jgi:hypothetical protein
MSTGYDCVIVLVIEDEDVVGGNQLQKRTPTTQITTSYL